MTIWLRALLFAVLFLPQITSAQTGDTTKALKDTTIIEKVADVVHDSVKAQLKAPVVQVPVKLKSLILPGAFFTYGVITLNNGNFRRQNQEIKEFLWDRNPHRRNEVEDYTLLVPAAAVYALNIFGVRGEHNLVDRSVLYGMSNLVANGMVYGIKQFGIETRPDSSDNHSFPSGHTAEAFVSAEFMRLELRGVSPWYGVAGYAIAVGTGFMRMYNNKHWFDDVVAGAGVGIAATRFSYWFYPVLKHWLFGSRKVRSQTLIMPTYQNGAYGLGLVHRF